MRASRPRGSGWPAGRREEGILIGVGGSLANVVRLPPPLVLGESEAARVSDTLPKVLGEVNGSL